MSKYLTSVDPENGVAQLDTGEQIPITNMMCLDGEDTINPAFCRRGVAGPCADGDWYPFSCDASEDDFF